MTGSYLSNGNLSKQFSALIVFCDIICSYLCSFYDEVYDFWHMTWKMTKCSLCFMCCNVTSLSWQMFDVPRLICLFNCLKFILAYLSHLEWLSLFSFPWIVWDLKFINSISSSKQSYILVHICDMIFMKSGSYFPCLSVSLRAPSQVNFKHVISSNICLLEQSWLLKS